MAETISSLTGQPIVVTLAGKQHKFRRLTLAELFGKFEADVKTDWLSRAHEMANQLPLEERIEFLSYQAAHPLTAEQSMNLVREKMNSTVGIALIMELTHLVESKDDVLPDIMSLAIDPAEQMVVKGLIEELTGTTGVKVEGKDSPKV